MLNVIGLFLTFIGTLSMVMGVLLSKPKKGQGTTWGYAEEIQHRDYTNRKYTIIGLTIIGVGFLVQLLDAILIYIN